MVELHGVGTELRDARRERGGGCGRGERRRWRRAPLGQRGRESRGEDEARERVRESQGLRGAPWRGLGRRAASSAKQEVAGALGRAPRLASAYWQRKTTSGEVDGLGWAAGGAGPGKWAPGRSSLLCFIFLLFCFSIYFATVLNLKIIQTMPKAPLNIFILLDGLFQKLIKYFRDI